MAGKAEIEAYKLPELRAEYYTFGGPDSTYESD